MKPYNIHFNKQRTELSVLGDNCDIQASQKEGRWVVLGFIDEYFIDCKWRNKDMILDDLVKYLNKIRNKK